MSFFSLSSMADMFVRPRRQEYRIADLGRNQINVNGVRHYREDFRIEISPFEFLQCSVFSRFTRASYYLLDRCIIYLHCNTGSRVQGMPYVRHLLAENFAVMLFDFRGSGMSSGNYVSLGKHEAHDIKIVMNYLRQVNPNMQIAFWGRSMGAVAAIRYCSTHNDITAAVLDSPFSSLVQLAQNVGSKNTILPKFIISYLLKFLRSDIEQKAGVDIYQVDNHSIINSVSTSLIFVTSEHDNVVPSEQVIKLYEEFTRGQKQLIYMEKDHHQIRDLNTIKNIITTLKSFFQSAKPATTAHHYRSSANNWKDARMHTTSTTWHDQKKTALSLCNLHKRSL